MKKIISVFALAALMSVAALAQDVNKDQKKGNDDAWRERVRAEQVAFITSELNLTEAEAQKFWPVYNDIQAKRREAYKASFEAMKAVEEGLEKGEDTGKGLDNYLEAKRKINDLEADAVKKYSKVLPKDKVAKLVLTEERFRHNQIGKLGKGGMPGGHGQMHPGQRPGGQRPEGQRPGKKFQKEQ